MPVSGPVLLPTDRSVVWRNLCMIGDRFSECIVEFSENSNKFFICAFEIAFDRYHTIILFKKQSQKLLKAC